MPVIERPVLASDRPRSFFEFTVEGIGTFPFDMLRYDQCWPKRESEDSTELELHPRSTRVREARQVTLVGISPPTEGRWASFGWRVL